MFRCFPVCLLVPPPEMSINVNALYGSYSVDENGEIVGQKQMKWKINLSPILRTFVLNSLTVLKSLLIIRVNAKCIFQFYKNLFQYLDYTWLISILLVYVNIYEHFQSLIQKLLKEQRKNEPLNSLSTSVNFGVCTNFEYM